MKILCALLVCFISINVDAQSYEVMTFNIRLNVASDSLNAWPHRKDKVASQILYHNVDILGVQEALHDQMIDLKQRLPGMKYIGVARDDGKMKGEYSAIFYDTMKFSLLESSTFWLSLTPEQPGSKSWDAAITRIVSWAKFQDRKSRKIFFVFNTHFDHMGVVARKESAHLLKKKVAEIAGKHSTIITGDFNSRPADDPIKVLTDKEGPDSFIDAKAISQKPHYGPTGTFNAFRSREVDDQPIDYIFIKGKWKVLNHATISQTWQGRFASDHFAVLATLAL